LTSDTMALGAEMAENQVGELLSLVRERLDRYVQGDRSDPSLILGDEVMEAAAELWRSASEETPYGVAVPYDVVEALGWLHWNCYAALPVGRDRYELQVAAAMFVHIFKIDPGAVPDDLREVLADEEAVMDIPDSLGRIALLAVQSASGYPGAFDPTVRTGPGWDFREASAILGAARKDNSADLDRAISLLRSSANAAPHDDPSRTSILSSLGNALQLRIVRAEDPVGQDKAVDVARAVAAEHPTSPVMLNHLAIALASRGRTRGNLSDLDDAIAASRVAIEMASPKDRNYVTFRANLAASLETRYHLTGSRSDLDACVDAYLTAAGAVPHDHPHRAGLLAKVGQITQLLSN
jgi:hypothetical protein